jgi:hypothetical protein
MKATFHIPADQQKLSKKMSLRAAESFCAGEKFGFGSPEQKAASELFYSAKWDYEQYCRDNGLVAYETYNE